jgi:hypothetical protein
MEGRYESFTNWLQQIERSNVLVDMESIRGAKNNNSGDVITFTVKMYTYGINID